MREITLNRGLAAFVDDEDYQRVTSVGRWSADIYHGGRIYARRSFKGKRVYLHRFILGVIDPKIDVDHINGDGLDCRKQNLRTCSRSENMHNRNVAIRIDNKTGVKGVYFDRFYERYKAEIKINGRKIGLGMHKTLESAKNARLKAEHNLEKGLPIK